MKKSLMAGIIMTVVSFGFFGTAVLSADNANNQVIKAAIGKYKAGNFLGCISDLKLVTDKDPDSAVSWYYLGSAYMNIAMKAEAHEAFDRVVALNTVPQLTSYSIQAKLCMENPANCNYQKFNAEQIDELKADPNGFLTNFFASKDEPQDEGNEEIEKLIHGEYADKMHPDAKEFVEEQRIKMQQLEINSNRVYIEPNEKIAQALKVLHNTETPVGMASIIENVPHQAISPEAVKLMQIQDSTLNYGNE
ncbi:hypothetical protein II906_12995 [bacterium]|nr:hypothetical protein [bacterium]